MYFSRKFSLIALSATLTSTTAFADTGSTQVLEDYFGFLKQTPLVLNVSDKDSGVRSSKWSGISVATEDGTFTANIPWIEASAGLLGGHTMTFAEEFDFRYADPKKMAYENFSGVIKNEGLTIDVSGEEDDQNFASSFDKITFTTMPGTLLEVNAVVTGGEGLIKKTIGDFTAVDGTFAYDELDMQYEVLAISQSANQAMKSDTNMKNLSGNYSFAWSNDISWADPSAALDGIVRGIFEYKSDAVTAKSKVGTGMGMMNIDVEVGQSDARYSFQDKVFELTGTSNDVAYNIKSALFPPATLTADTASAKIGFPIENTEVAKPLDLAFNIQGLELSEQIWGMVDPNGMFVRDKANLNIDLTSEFRWLNKLNEIDRETKKIPFQFESARIKAFDLDLLGAEMKSTGEFDIDNSQLPPVPLGTIDVNLKGINMLLDTLSAAGMVSLQQSIAARGMMSVFFDQSSGDDELSTVLEFKEDGHIYANGIQFK